ncbi:MAG TPA: aspartate-semialdehyde dehydrogenase [Chloroflexi bacterium]|mgnify:CR=1 FL=1|nr:aspartate-semialdehyde dehydrogenase [Chloroflexota bacterium]
MAKIPVGVLGATGTVGQRFIQLLADHPWFEVKAVAASDRSIGQRYAEACHWLLPTPIPVGVRDLLVQPIEPGLDCRLLFSALPSDVGGPAEEAFARAGYAVCSNASAHRMDGDVPLLIPEVNAGHTALIETQRRERGWEGLLVASANCTGTQLTLGLKPLQEAFGLRQVLLVSMQAVSGAGYPGVPSLDILGNVVPYIGGEEDKVEAEPRKMLGALQGDGIAAAPFTVSAHCNRVPVRDGHTLCVSVALEREASVDEIVAALADFRGSPEAAGLPSSPAAPIVVCQEPDRPQPIRDRDTDGGMAVVVGRVRACPVFDVKFVLLGHNTVRGAAGGSIHNAELLVAQGWVER